MQQSETITDLAKALAKVQGEIRGVVPDQSNSHFRSKYASLGNIIATCKPHLASHGLSFTQSVGLDDRGIVVTTQLTHESGQWMRGTAHVPVEKSTAHGIGSATTYGRRYSLAAILGIADCEDDDGNAASNGNGNGAKRGGSSKLRDTLSKPAAKAPPADVTRNGARVAVGIGDPTGSPSEGDLWIDAKVAPVRVLRADGDGDWDDLMPEDPPYQAAYETLAKMVAAKAKENGTPAPDLFDALALADKLDKPPRRLSEASLDALAAVYLDLECPL